MCGSAALWDHTSAGLQSRRDAIHGIVGLWGCGVVGWTVVPLVLGTAGRERQAMQGPTSTPSILVHVPGPSVYVPCRSWPQGLGLALTSTSRPSHSNLDTTA